MSGVCGLSTGGGIVPTCSQGELCDVLDIPAQPEVFFHHDRRGRYIGRRGGIGAAQPRARLGAPDKREAEQSRKRNWLLGADRSPGFL